MKKSPFSDGDRIAWELGALGGKAMSRDRKILRPSQIKVGVSKVEQKRIEGDAFSRGYSSVSEYGRALFLSQPLNQHSAAAAELRRQNEILVLIAQELRGVRDTIVAGCGEKSISELDGQLYRWFWSLVELTRLRRGDK